MKSRSISVLSLFLFFLLFIACDKEKDDKSKKTTYYLTGEVLDTTQKSVLLLRPYEDFRFQYIEIPLKNGKIDFKITLEHPEGFNLVPGDALKKGSFKKWPLFLDKDTINITMYPPKDFGKSTIKGGALNEEYKKFKDTLMARFMTSPQVQKINQEMFKLEKENRFYSKEMQQIFSDLKNARNAEERTSLYKKQQELVSKKRELTPEGRALQDKADSINNQYEKWRKNWFIQKPSIASYFLFMDDLAMNTHSKEMSFLEAESIYKKLSKANPEHPYNQVAKDMLDAMDQIKLGNPYIDFTLPNLNGKMFTLSEEISGKVALIDLWATWCAPCIVKSRKMVPVYEAYKDKGFTVVGVAGEFKNTDRLEHFLEKEKFPWLNLVDLDKKYKIWLKYNIPNSGGGTFLIDKSGKIIAIDPTAEEVKKALDTLL